MIALKSEKKGSIIYTGNIYTAIAQANSVTWQWIYSLGHALYIAKVG